MPRRDSAHYSEWLDHWHILYFEFWLASLRRATGEYDLPYFYFDPSDRHSLSRLNKFIELARATSAANGNGNATIGGAISGGTGAGGTAAGMIATASTASRQHELLFGQGAQTFRNGVPTGDECADIVAGGSGSSSSSSSSTASSLSSSSNSSAGSRCGYMLDVCGNLRSEARLPHSNNDPTHPGSPSQHPGYHPRSRVPHDE